MPVSKDDFRRAMSCFAGGVTIVTTCRPDGQVVGITVSAFCSLSLDPPLILICIDRKASIHDHLRLNAAFAVNILAETQQAVSRRFASKELDRFSGLEYSRSADGVPLIAGSLAFVECTVANIFPGGDHSIVVGEVKATNVDSSGWPLTYFRGAYSTLAR